MKPLESVKTALRQYIDCHPAPAAIGQADYAARIAIETAHAELDHIPIVPARLIRSDAPLQRIADELGPEAGEVFVQESHVQGNQKHTQSRATSKAWLKWARRKR